MRPSAIPMNRDEIMNDSELSCLSGNEQSVSVKRTRFRQRTTALPSPRPSPLGRGRIVRRLLSPPDRGIGSRAQEQLGMSGSGSLPLNVGRASRLPSRRSRRKNSLRARACALAGQAGRLPYVAGTRWGLAGSGVQCEYKVRRILSLRVRGNTTKFGAMNRSISGIDKCVESSGGAGGFSSTL
jgi:hypothetical protein